MLPSPLVTSVRRFSLAVVVVVLCCAGGVPAVAGAPPDAPVETPSPGVETPDPGQSPVAPVENATGNVTGTVTGNTTENATENVVPTPGVGESAVRNGSGEVRTAVEASRERVDDAEWRTGTSWTPLGVDLGPLDTRRRSPTPSRTASATGVDAAATTASETPRPSPSATEPTVTTAAGADGCGYCGSVFPAGVVLLGLAGGAGAAASLGATPPQSALGPSRAVRHWVERRVPRLPPVLPGRFGRSADADPLDDANRRAVREAVDARPGVPLGRVVDELPLSRSSVRHHVRVLADADELETAKLLGRRRLFPPDADTELLAALADEGSRRVVQAVAAVGPATVGEVVDEADRAYSTVSYHLDRLETAGVVVRERDGRHVTVRLADDAADLLTRDEPVAAD